MTAFSTDLKTLLQSLTPVLNSGVYAFCVVPLERSDLALPTIATFREQEGLTVVLPEVTAKDLHLSVVFRAAWITLSVQSELASIGLTAAVSRELAEANISCNMFAGAYHDHLFVPVDCGATAIEVLLKLQARHLAL